MLGCCSKGTGTVDRQQQDILHFHPLELRHRLGKFDVAAYNALLKKPRFWDCLAAKHKRVLIVQDDSAILRPGLEESGLMQHEYIGPPWSRLNPPALAAEVGSSDVVGNGGLSLRDPAMCAALLRRFDAHKVSFDGHDYPEDVFFSRAFRRAGRRIADRMAAGAFGVEQELVVVFSAAQRRGETTEVLGAQESHSPLPPFGVHKVYAYQSLEVLEYLLEAYARGVGLAAVIHGTGQRRKPC
jgi:hypothetical protein